MKYFNNPVYRIRRYITRINERGQQLPAKQNNNRKKRELTSDYSDLTNFRKLLCMYIRKIRNDISKQQGSSGLSDVHIKSILKKAVTGLLERGQSFPVKLKNKGEKKTSDYPD